MRTSATSSNPTIARTATASAEMADTMTDNANDDSLGEVIDNPGDERTGARPDPMPDPPLVPIDVVPPAGSWTRATVYLPDPVSPLMESWFTTYEDAFRAAYAEFGVLVDTNMMCCIGGYAYGRTVPLGGDRGSKPPPWWVLGVLSRVVPQMRRRIKVGVDAVRSDRAGTVANEWELTLRGQMLDRARRLRTVDLETLTDGQLLAHVEEVDALLTDGTHAHFRLAIANQVIGHFAVTVHDLLGWDDRQVAATLAGLSPMSSEPARRLAEIRRLPETHQAAAIDDFRAELGVRLVGHDVMDATVGEVPGLLEQIMAGQDELDFDPGVAAESTRARRTEVRTAARDRLAGRPEDIDRFEAALAAAERMYSLREDNVNLTLVAPWGLLRLAALEVGRRLVENEQISVVDDVFFLDSAELRESLRSSVDHRGQIRVRRGQRAWAEQNPGPDSYGPPFGGMPDLRALPPEIQQMTAALGWIVNRLGVIPESSTKDHGMLSGVGASPGVHEGTVRVIRGDHEFHKLEPGDVLVCPTTTPAWSLLFSMVGALVTDVGALMTHPAIIAREFGIPAVVNVGNATELLRDGQRVRVDGGAGTVELVDG